MSLCHNPICQIIRIAVLFFCTFCLAQSSYSGGFDDKDFSLRLPAALSRFSSYADVAATGGGSAGSKWQSSVNPASTAWQPTPGSYQMTLNPQYSAIVFDEGTVLNVISESITKDFNVFGTVQVSLAQVRSNERADRQGITFGYDMDFFQMQWGRHLSDNLAVGLNFNYSSSNLTNKIGAEKLADSSSDSYGMRAGMLYRVIPNLLAGIVVDYSESPSKTAVYDLFGTGSGTIYLDDRTRQFSLRVGPSYEYAKDSTILVDYQLNTYKNSTGTMDIHRFFAGIDHRILDALFVRGGFVLDTLGNSSWTAGMGIYPLKKLSIDVGYQYNMFPEIQKEFGRSHLATMSLSLLL